MRLDDGAEKSEYTLGLGVAFDDDEPLPSDGVCRVSLALLLLERRLVSMNGKRSFMREDERCSSFGRVSEEHELGIEERRRCLGMGLELGRGGSLGDVCESLHNFNGGRESGETLREVDGSTESSRFVGVRVSVFIDSCSETGEPSNSWTTTVVSSSDICVNSRRCPVGVVYWSLIAMSSVGKFPSSETSCESQAFQSRLERAELVTRRGDGVPIL